MPDEPTTPAAAEAEIASKLGDADFQTKYNDRHHDGHATAIAEMTHLHKIAAGEAEPPTQPSGDDPADESVDAVGDAELQAAEAEMEDEYGAGWQEQAELARETALRIGGQQGLDNLVAQGHGNDLEAIRPLVELGQRDKTFPAVALVQEILGRIRTPDQARLELQRRMADIAFVDAWLTKHDPRHEETVIEMRVLQEIADIANRTGAA